MNLLLALLLIVTLYAAVVTGVLLYALLALSWLHDRCERLEAAALLPGEGTPIHDELAARRVAVAR